MTAAKPRSIDAPPVRWREGAVAALLAALVAMAGLPTGAAAETGSELRIGYLGLRVERPLPHSFMDRPPQDEGVAGARVGVADNTTTGRFTGQSFALDETIVGEREALPGAFRGLVGGGRLLVIVDVPAADLVALADLPEAKEATL